MKYNNLNLVDNESLKPLNKILELKTEFIINTWVNNKNLEPIFKILEIEKDVFKERYAYHIFNHFLSFIYDSESFNPLYLESFINEFKDKRSVISIIYQIFTQLKNTLILCLMEYNISSDIKLHIFESFSNIIDNAVVDLLDSISDYYQRDYAPILKKLKLLEDAALVTRTDNKGNITFMSESLLKLLGYSKEEMINNGFGLIRHPEVPHTFYEKMWKTLKAGKIFKGIVKNLTKNKEEVIFHTHIVPNFDVKGAIDSYTAIKTNLTDKTKARTDSLTGILNRLAFNEYLTDRIDKYNDFYEPFSLILIDIDYFSDVNNTYGHIIGDKILKQFVKLINEMIRPTDIFARWGGEEFVIVQNNSLNIAIKTAERIRKHIEQNMFPEVGQKTCSSGVAEFNHDYPNIESFINELDKALYYSKEHGRNKVSYIVKNGIEIV